MPLPRKHNLPSLGDLDNDRKVTPGKGLPSIDSLPPLESETSDTRIIDKIRETEEIVDDEFEEEGVIELTDEDFGIDAPSYEDGFIEPIVEEYEEITEDIYEDTYEEITEENIDEEIEDEYVDEGPTEEELEEERRIIESYRQDEEQKEEESEEEIDEDALSELKSKKVKNEKPKFSFGKKATKKDKIDPSEETSDEPTSFDFAKHKKTIIIAGISVLVILVLLIVSSFLFKGKPEDGNVTSKSTSVNIRTRKSYIEDFKYYMEINSNQDTQVEFIQSNFLTKDGIYECFTGNTELKKGNNKVVLGDCSADISNVEIIKTIEYVKETTSETN